MATEEADCSAMTTAELLAQFQRALAGLSSPEAGACEPFAPVQLRTEGDIIGESSTWRSLSGRHGAPFDPVGSRTRQRLLLCILPPRPLATIGAPDDCEPPAGGESESDVALRAELDMHAALAGHNCEAVPTQSADQVIREIDEIMQTSGLFDVSAASEQSAGDLAALAPASSAHSLCMYASGSSAASAHLLGENADLAEKALAAAQLVANPKKLGSLRYKQLCALHAELETIIKAYNEALVQELAEKDEAEYDKELKNTFISLILDVQAKRRIYAQQQKRVGEPQPQFATFSVPVNLDNFEAAVGNRSLRALCNVLRAVNEDSPSVPTVLTDYILNVVCPSSEGGL